MQQFFLRWNQGQDLRQALITIAIAIILADQMLAHFGGIAEDITWPGDDRQVRQPPRRGHPVHADAADHRRDRLASASASGSGSRGRAPDGDPRRRRRPGDGVRARHQHPATFAIAFFVGSALAGLGGVIGGSFASLAPGVDSNWLLNSLVVVIIGGMGSLGGAAIGSLLLGLTTNFSAAYLPSNYTYYSIIFTFVLLAIVLAVRPLGICGRPA